MLCAIQFDDQASVGTKEVHFHHAPVVEWNGQFRVQAKAAGRVRQCLQAAIKKRLTRAAGAGNAFGVRQGRPRRVNKQVGEGNINAITNQPAHAGGVILLPLRLNRQRHFNRPSRQRAGRE
jgi:hypothetical protein